MNSNITNFLLALLLLAVIISLPVNTMASSEECATDNKAKNGERWGMPGGFSAPHEASAEEQFLLKKTWFEACSKCSHMPKEFEKIKICSVSRQGWFPLT